MLQGFGDQFPCRCKNDRAVRQDRHLFGVFTHPFCAQSCCQLFMFLSPRAHVNFAAHMQSDLITIWADDPNPYIARLSPLRRPLRFRLRYPIMPAHSRGGACWSEKTSGIGYANSSFTTANSAYPPCS